MKDEQKEQHAILLPTLPGRTLPTGLDLPPPGFVHLYRVGEDRIGVHHSDGRFEVVKADE